jgi:hypothetical protein
MRRRSVGKWRYSSIILDLSTRWRLVISFKPLPLYPEEMAPGTHWIGDCVGPRADMNCSRKRKSFPQPGIEPQFNECSSSITVVLV